MAGKKAKRKNRRSVQVSKLYDKGVLKAQTCPKCGPGVVLARHKDRNSCGKCGYTEFKKQ